MKESSNPDGLLWLLVPPLVYLFFVLFFIGWLLPRIWVAFVSLWLRILLGGSPASQRLIKQESLNFKLFIEQYITDEGVAPTLAVLMAIKSHSFELVRRRRPLRKAKAERVDQAFISTTENLIEGWRDGTEPDILKGYMRIIRDSADDKDIDPVLKARALGSVAIAMYALGDVIEANKLAKRNWEDANRLERDYESKFKWMAAYGYFYSTMFLGKAKPAMNMMAEQWSRHYAHLDDKEKENMRHMLADQVILNPILSIPRHMSLAATFNGAPIFSEKYWPNQKAFRSLGSNPSDPLELEIKWLHAWYEEALRICPSEPISLNFSHAYAGFYLTLLLPEQRMQHTGLHDMIEKAFNSIEDSSPIVNLYIKYGFSGVYNLVCGEYKKALDNLRKALRLSAVSGNRFADCIFMCSCAIAAARCDSSLEPEINYRLLESEKLANTLGSSFYSALSKGARSTVCELLGAKGQAKRLRQMSLEGLAGNRILRVFTTV